jgi:acyl CoA:acetate/3-ketoacid CoA transferase beta subunit
MEGRTVSDAQLADICAIACAETWRDCGEIMISPFGSVPALGARVAKAMFSPEIVLTDGEAALAFGVEPLTTKPSDLVREAYVPYKTIFSVVWSGRRHIMMMASQVDRFGNQNIAAIGPRNAPKAQLVGVRGAPGNSVNHPTSYWVPDHNPRAFVDSVDVVCGVGNERARAAGTGATTYHDLRRVISNLGVFDFSGPDGSMHVVSLHPGVDADLVARQTAFELDGLATASTTRLPTDEELALLELLDPKGARHREVPES